MGGNLNASPCCIIALKKKKKILSLSSLSLRDHAVFNKDCCFVKSRLTKKEKRGRTCLNFSECTWIFANCIGYSDMFSLLWVLLFSGVLLVTKNLPFDKTIKICTDELHHYLQALFPVQKTHLPHSVWYTQPVHCPQPIGTVTQRKEQLHWGGDPKRSGSRWVRQDCHNRRGVCVHCLSHYCLYAWVRHLPHKRPLSQQTRSF